MFLPTLTIFVRAIRTITVRCSVDKYKCLESFPLTQNGVRQKKKRAGRQAGRQAHSFFRSFFGVVIIINDDFFQVRLFLFFSLRRRRRHRASQSVRLC